MIAGTKAEHGQKSCDQLARCHGFALILTVGPQDRKPILGSSSNLLLKPSGF